MHIKKITKTNCELIPQLFSKHNLDGNKVYLPMPIKYMWLQKYAKSHEPTIQVKESFEELLGNNKQSEMQIIKRDFSKKLKPYKGASKENTSRSKLNDIDKNQFNITSYNNDNRKILFKEKQLLQTENQYKSILGSQNSYNISKKLYCKSTDIYNKKYQSTQAIDQFSKRKKGKINNPISVGGNQKQLINRLEFKKYHKQHNKEEMNLPISKTTRKAVNPFQTINIKNAHSQRNTITKNLYIKKSQTKRQKFSNKENQIHSIQLLRSQQQHNIDKKFNNFLSANIYKNKTANNTNTKKQTRKYREEKQLVQFDSNIDLNPWNHQQSSMSFSQINLEAQ